MMKKYKNPCITKKHVI